MQHPVSSLPVHICAMQHLGDARFVAVDGLAELERLQRFWKTSCRCTSLAFQMHGYISYLTVLIHCGC